MVTPLARRRVSVIARQTATLDRLAAGRLRLGVGLGAPDDEFTRFGEDADPKRRAQILDESLDALQLLWSGESVSYRGGPRGDRRGRVPTDPGARSRPDLGRRRVAGRRPVPTSRPLRRRLAGFEGGWLPDGRRLRRVRRRGSRPAPRRHRRSTPASSTAARPAETPRRPTSWAAWPPAG